MIRRILLPAALLAVSCKGSPKSEPSPAPSSPPPPAVEDAGATAAAEDAGPPPAPVVETKPKKFKRVLHLGDSMVGFHRGLTMALGHRFKKQGAKFYSDSLTSAQVQNYDSDRRMVRWIKDANPDLVIFNMGSNNVQVPHPEALASSVRALVKKMSGRECYWLGPPLPIKGLKHDTGIRKVIADNAAPCKFFDTSRLVLERQKDRVHPTDRGGEVWGEAVFEFIMSDAPSDTVEDEPGALSAAK